MTGDDLEIVEQAEYDAALVGLVESPDFLRLLVSEYVKTRPRGPGVLSASMVDFYNFQQGRHGFVASVLRWMEHSQPKQYFAFLEEVYKHEYRRRSIDDGVDTDDPRPFDG